MAASFACRASPPTVGRRCLRDEPVTRDRTSSASQGAIRKSNARAGSFENDNKDEREPMKTAGRTIVAGCRAAAAETEHSLTMSAPYTV